MSESFLFQEEAYALEKHYHDICNASLAHTLDHNRVLVDQTPLRKKAGKCDVEKNNPQAYAQGNTHHFFCHFSQHQNRSRKIASFQK